MLKGIDIGGTFTGSGRVAGWAGSYVQDVDGAAQTPARGLPDSLTLAGCDLPALDEVLHGLQSRL